MGGEVEVDFKHCYRGVINMFNTYFWFTSAWRGRIRKDTISSLQKSTDFFHHPIVCIRTGRTPFLPVSLLLAPRPIDKELIEVTMLPSSLSCAKPSLLFDHLPITWLRSLESRSSSSAKNTYNNRRSINFSIFFSFFSFINIVFEKK